MVCFECGDVATQQHHVVPRSRGGTRTVPLCARCHGLVHDVHRSDEHAELVRDGIGRTRDLGRRYGGVPYGWQDVDGRLTKDFDEQAVLDVIADMRTIGHSVATITAQLNLTHVQHARGQRWYTATVTRICEANAW